MGIFTRRSRQPPDALALFFNDGGCLPEGYTRLLDSPEIGACIDRICEIVSAATLRLMKNGRDGDERVRDELSRFVDISPWAPMGTRAQWVSWIVATMLGAGDGNAFCLPHFGGTRERPLLTGLEPMPGAVAVDDPAQVYVVHWNGREYAPDEILHFRLFADGDKPWKGRGYRVKASRLAASLKQVGELKDSLSSPSYKPPLAVAVNSDSDLSDPKKREAFRARYLDDTADGKPWIIPADLMKLEQIRPLSLSDLAVKDTVELDKRTVASIFGMPAFLLGLGGFNLQEYNSFIRTVIIHLCEVIEQELTAKLLISPERYFRFNRRHLYAYDMKDTVAMYLSMADRGYVNGDEVRAQALLDPAGLTEFHALENYIPYDMLGLQQKLVPTSGTGE